jgi:cytochrome c-type biogenesis protein
MLLLFSAGLGIPFVISAILIHKLSKAFESIKKHYRFVNIISGSLLVIAGLFMAFGKLNAFLTVLTF